MGASGLIEYAPENLLSKSEEFNDAAWTKERASIVTNTITAPDGTLTAEKLVEDTTATSSHRVTRQITLIAAAYTFSVFVKSAERNWVRLTLFDGTTNRQVWFDTTAGVIGTQSGATGQITSFGNGWWRCSITATGVAAISQTNVALATGDNISSYTGDGASGIYLWGAQLEQYSSARTYIPTTTAAVYGARFDHDPITLACKGLLIEESRTNSILQSEAFSSTSWANGVVTRTADQIASPSGATTADLITSVTGNFGGKLAQNFTFATTTYTASIFVKKGNWRYIGIQLADVSSSAVIPSFDFDTETVSQNGTSYATIGFQKYGNGWYRITLTQAVTAISSTFAIWMTASNGNVTGPIGAGNTVYIWGAQLEAGSFPTSYIPTTTASVVRSADICSISGANFTSFYNQSEGTVYTESRPATVNGTTTTFSLSNGTASERWLTRFAQNEQVVVTSAGTESAFDSLNPVAGTLYKTATAGKLNDFALSINGIAVVTDTSQPMPNADRAGIGNATGAVAGGGAVTIASIRYYKKRLANAKLVTLTA